MPVDGSPPETKPDHRRRARWAPRLRTVLVLANLALLLFPLGGIVVLRLYESVLLRRTESELLVQGVVVAAAYQVSLSRELADSARRGAYGAPLPAALRERFARPFRPVTPRLDLAEDRVRPDAPPPRPPAVAPDPVAAAAGRSLTAVLRQVQQSTLAGIRVVDWRGTVVASTRGELGLSLAHREEVRRALGGVETSLVRRRPPSRGRQAGGSLRRASELRVFVALPVVLRGRVVGAVVLSRTPPSVAQTIERRRGLFVGGALAALGLVIALSLLTAWTVARPLRALVDQAVRLTRGERGAAHELAHPGTREVRELSRAFVEMARALDERSEYIRTFAASVSHEFKTPLTGIRGAVELLGDHLDEMSPEERTKFLANLDADARRLERLVQGLLELARAEVTSAGSERTDAEAVVRREVERYAAEGLEVALGPGGESASGGRLPRVPVSETVLESLIRILLENARQHGAPPVSVRLGAADAEGRGESRIRIEVCDAGPGISEANLPRIFDRFFTTARDTGGSGLGLAIARVLVESHGGGVQCESAPGRTCFTVVLPATREE